MPPQPPLLAVKVGCVKVGWRPPSCGVKDILVRGCGVGVDDEAGCLAGGARAPSGGASGGAPAG